MTHQDNVIKMVAEMEEKEAKSLLAEIFLKVDRVGTNYTKDKCYEDIERIYQNNVVGKMIFGK
ncbi:hypothetical protein DRW41_00545 [Neobacillus piezotolerans]|uniref:Uncharacterized protein n=1 Tax=Neobacillus piezotolerans TaxID=2259171 RepID=A0A3D8GUG7_9BACI|nr:hypothetical protein [Neobacillus piezotolerans]RDU38098.1 hypothetical protein DRW41_00545 [Neobacillus piezotolerans]